MLLVIIFGGIISSGKEGVYEYILKPLNMTQKSTTKPVLHKRHSFPTKSH